MKFLICKLCKSEVDLVDNDHSINRKTKCRKCGFGTGEVEKSNSGPEVVIIKRRQIN
jgi:hypothetical protein